MSDSPSFPLLCAWLATALLPVGVAAPHTQDPTPPAVKPPEKPVPPPVGGPQPVPPAETGEPVLLGSDGEPLAPGRIPANTDAAARAAWESMLAATLGKSGERKPVKAFSLEIDVVFKSRVESTNQLAGLYEFLAPGFVRVRFKESRRETLRGPEGDWLIDPDKHEVSPIERTREDEDSTRQLDDMISVARNFVALTDPKSLRIARLARLPAPPPVLGREYAARAKELVWIDIESPDFRLARAAKPGARTTPYRVQLGLDAASSLPALALVHDGGAQAPLAPTTLFLALADWFDADGTKVPKQVKTYEVDPRTLAAGASDAAQLRFQLDPTSDVVITKARINPPLTADAFRPPKKL